MEEEVEQAPVEAAGMSDTYISAQRYLHKNQYD